MPGTATYSSTGNSYVDGVLSGVKWAVSNLTFSFPSSPTFYEYPGEPNVNFKPFNAAQQTATRSILKMDASVANLTFTEITETSAQHGDLRLAGSDAPSTAWAYYPTTGPAGGDAWFNVSNHYYDNPIKGNYAFLAITHELGHALGLKHPHEPSGAFGAMPPNHDSLEYSVMSYHSYVGSPLTGYTNEPGGYPQTLMMYDIAGLQAEYGANYATNSGDTTYRWDPNTGQTFIDGVGQGVPSANRVFLTVWDGGGKDTYDFSSYSTNLTVNLEPGSWTTVSTAQLANLGGGHLAAGNIANALLYQNKPASLIENVVGGSGNDTIVGNAADNRLTGGHGSDVLNGAAGTNTAVYSGTTADYLVSQNSDGSWTVADLRAGSPDGTDSLKNIQYLEFSGSTVALGAFSPQNSPPVAADDSYATSMNTQLVLSSGAGLLANDTDPDGNALTAALVSMPSHGSLSLGTDGSLTYIPNADFVGTDSFTYKASDGVADSTATATINVHNPLVASDDYYAVANKTKLVVTASGVLANDLGGADDILSATLVSKPTAGKVTLDTSGAFIYTPNKKFSGIDFFTYKVSDGATSDTATVWIKVGASGQASPPTHNALPVAADDSFTTAIKTALKVVDSGVLANDTDADGNLLSAVLVSKPGHGKVSLNADGTFVYTPSKKFIGQDSFSYKVSDGWSLSDLAIVTVQVGATNPSAQNASPVAADDAYTTAIKTKLKVGDSGVLTNDTDADGNLLSAVLVSKPSHGKVSLNADGTFVYKPSKEFVGQDSFSYKVSDGASLSDVATATIQVGNPDLTEDQILPPHSSNSFSHSGSHIGRVEKFQALFNSNDHKSQHWASVHNGGDSHAPAIEDHNLPGTHDAHLLLQ